MTRAMLATLALSACAVAPSCPPDPGTWYVDFSASPCGVRSSAEFEALKDTCTRLSVAKPGCAQDVDFLCPNGVRITMHTDPAEGYGIAMIERGECVAFIEGEIR